MDALTQIPLTMAVNIAGLVAGTTSTITTANTVPYCIRGKGYSKAATANIVTPTTDAATGLAFTAIPAGTSTAAYGCVFVVGFDAAGAIKVCQGHIQATDLAASGANTKFIIAPQFPPIPDTMCPFGYVIVKVGTSGAAWTFGTSNLTGPPANTSITYVDCFTLPDRPQVS